MKFNCTGVRLESKQRSRQLAATRANQAIQPHDFTAPHLEGNIVELVPGRTKVAEAKQGFTRRPARSALKGLQLASHHARYQLIHRQAFRGFAGDSGTVAQGGNRVADFEHLFQAMADVEDRDASGFQAQQLFN